MPTKLAFVTYETPFTPAGGIAAVMGRLPHYIFKASGLETIVVTPYHHKIGKTANLPTQEVGQTLVASPGGTCPSNCDCTKKMCSGIFSSLNSPIFSLALPILFMWEILRMNPLETF